MAELEELQAECMADDVPIGAHMLAWGEAAVREYLESGGEVSPDSKRRRCGSNPALPCHSRVRRHVTSATPSPHPRSEPNGRRLKPTDDDIRQGFASESISSLLERSLPPIGSGPFLPGDSLPVSLAAFAGVPARTTHAHTHAHRTGTEASRATAPLAFGSRLPP